MAPQRVTLWPMFVAEVTGAVLLVGFAVGRAIAAGNGLGAAIIGVVAVVVAVLLVSRHPYALGFDGSHVGFQVVGPDTRAPLEAVEIRVRWWSIVGIVQYPDMPPDRFRLWTWPAPGRRRLLDALRATAVLDA
jgi:hypothetical protein